MTTRIKVCGITRSADAEVVVAAGVDALGLVFTEHSPRQIAADAAAEIAQQVAGRVTRVGLFVDASAAEVEATLRMVELDLLQFHGAETAQFCGSFGLPYMKALRVRERVEIAELETAYADACCLLLDAYVPGQPGGTGQTFDWCLWPQHPAKSLVLAGGLHPDNVAAAIRQTRPYAVDVSGGVEGAVKGEKDAAKIFRFVKEVKSAGV
ncbi:MAG: phosphoribosylanthranilate isomerase [Pseudomonadales bacterium]